MQPGKEQEARQTDQIRVNLWHIYNMSVKSSTELMLYVVLTMPTLNKAYLFIYLFII